MRGSCAGGMSRKILCSGKPAYESPFDCVCVAICDVIVAKADVDDCRRSDEGADAEPGFSHSSSLSSSFASSCPEVLDLGPWTEHRVDADI